MRFFYKGTLLATSALLLAACNNTESAGNSTNENGEEVGNDTIEFSVATVRWADWGEDFLDGFIAETETEANVEIEWDIYLNSDWGDQKAVLMAGGELPDAFLGSISLTDSDIATFRSQFVPLNDLIEENMPNLTQALEEDATLRPLITSPDGEIYSLPAKLPMRPEAGNQMFINQTWLDNLGLDMPETYEDFEDVLTAFYEQDANGSGNTDDEIPFGAGNADAVYSYLLPFGTSMSPGTRNSWRLVDGEPTFLPTSEFYKEGIEWMHSHYKAGLIDEEIFTQDTSMSDSKRQNDGDALVGVSVGWTPDALFAHHADEYVAMSPLAGPDGERHVHMDSEIYSRNELVITQAADNPEAILRWADQFYTDDASIQTFYGSFGIATEKNDDGSYTVLEAPDGEADTFAWVNSLRDFGPKYVGDNFNENVTLPEGVGDGLKLSLDQQINDYVSEQYPNVQFTQEELNRLSVLGVDIESYITGMQATWIVEGGVEDQWDTYIDTLNQMGFEEYIQIQKDAYERFQENL